MTTFKRRALLSLASVAALGSSASWAQGRGDSPVTLIGPFAPGGGGDILARAIARGLEPALGRSVVVENVSGATGTIGLMRAARAEPDGNTFVYVSAVQTANAASRPQSSVDLRRDLAPIGMIAEATFVLAVSPTLGVKTVQDLIALGQKKRGGLHFASTGPGSNHHFLGEMFRSATGLELTHIPYRGEAVAIVDVAAGRVDMMFMTTAIAPYLADGRVVGLGITSREPWPLLPHLQPLITQGLPSLAYNGWNGLMAPRATPPAVIAKLNEALAAAIKSDAAVRAFAATGFNPVGGPPEAMARQIDADMKLFERLIREQKLTLDQ